MWRRSSGNELREGGVHTYINEANPNPKFGTKGGIRSSLNHNLPGRVLPPMKTTSNVLLTAIVAAVNTTPHGVFAVERRLLAETERRQLFETHTGGNMYVKRLGGQAESKEVEEPNSAAPTSKPVPTPIQKCLFGLANSGFDLFAIEKYNDWMDNETTFELAETGVRKVYGYNNACHY